MVIREEPQILDILATPLILDTQAKEVIPVTQAREDILAKVVIQTKVILVKEVIQTKDIRTKGTTITNKDAIQDTIKVTNTIITIIIGIGGLVIQDLIH